MKQHSWIMVILLAIISSSLFGAVLPHGLFTDNMVLQCDKTVPVWGTAAPGEAVSVAFAGQEKTTKADRTGHWLVRLEPLNTSSAPGPMVITGHNVITLKNILVGEVWLCSGQSNMAMGVDGSFGGKEAIAAADKPMIRLFTVPRQAEPTACEGFKEKSRWLVCSPKTLRFSAAGYYFGRELQDRLKVPVGLINASVGGTTAQAWTPLTALKADTLFDHYLQQYEKDGTLLSPAFAIRRQKRKDLYTEMNARVKDPGVQMKTKGLHLPTTDLSSWEEVQVPGGWFKNKTIYGSVWYRRDVEIPAGWSGKDLELKLGTLDDYDTTYFNGTKIGAIGPETQGWWMTPRTYTVPGRLVQAGKQSITIRIFNDFGNGGFTADADRLTLTLTSSQQVISLAGVWHRKVGHAIKTFTLPAPNAITSRSNVPSFLYNGMIAPLVPYGMRGVIWYQGEFNASAAYEYRALFPTMITAWRKSWGMDAFPFHFVQLPGFHPVDKRPGKSAWAVLRESQELTLKKTFNTGMAVTIDIGEANNIHPRNKQDVGLRLALVALAKTYGKRVEHSGPVCTSMRVEEGGLRLYFTPLGGGLTIKGEGPLKGFAICGADHEFLWADASIEGETVLVSNPKIKHPVAVRYAWSTNPGCNLFGKNNLPARPFRTDTFPCSTQFKR